MGMLAVILLVLLMGLLFVWLTLLTEGTPKLILLLLLAITSTTLASTWLLPVTITLCDLTTATALLGASLQVLAPPAPATL